MSLASPESLLNLGHVLLAFGVGLYALGRREASVIALGLGALHLLLTLFRFSNQVNLDSSVLASYSALEIAAGLIFYLLGYESPFRKRFSGRSIERAIYLIFFVIFLFAVGIEAHQRMQHKTSLRALHMLVWWTLAMALIFSKDSLILVALLVWSLADLFGKASGIYLTGLMDRPTGFVFYAVVVFLMPAFFLLSGSAFCEDRERRSLRLASGLLVACCSLAALLHLSGV